MKFPNSGNGRPYVRIDGRTGAFSLSNPEGPPTVFDVTGKLLAFDYESAQQGWLRVDQAGADWVPLNAPDEWTNPPAPSVEHSPGVRLDVFCKDWPDPKVRELRGNSRAVTGLVSEIVEKAGDMVKRKAVLVRIDAARIVKVGRGSTVNFDFTVAPADRWPDLSTLDPHRDAPQPQPAPAQSGDAWGDDDDTSDPDAWA